MNWLPHNGTACPVPPTTKVRVKLRNGAVAEPTEARIWEWRRYTGSPDLDIVAFAEVAQVGEAPKPLDYEEQFRLAVHSQAGAWGVVAILRDVDRRLRELEETR